MSAHEVVAQALDSIPADLRPSTVVNRERAAAVIVALRNAGYEVHAPCCTACKGTGATGDPETNGLCWDCRGTGHPHEPEVSE